MRATAVRTARARGLEQGWKRVRLAAVAMLALGGASMALLPGCGEKKEAAPKATLKPRYDVLPPRENVPAFMKGTVWEFADAENTQPYAVSSFGLVVGLAETGDNTGVPLSVRNYIRDEMVKHGFGAKGERLENYLPERVLETNLTAIVEVYGLLPPGARSGQRTDAFVKAVEGSGTSSLAGGTLYQCDLRIRGTDRLNPRGSVNVFGKAKGPVFVNPVYSSLNASTRPAAMASLRNGLVMNGGMVMMDRPIRFRVRQPQLSIARMIEMRIDQRYQDLEAARTQDEAYVNALVPHSFKGDWEHFVGVASHVYMNPSPGFGSVKAKELVAEALKPHAPLKDISFCWEGIGQEALPFIQPLYGHASAEIAFAAARAGACIRDAAAEEALLTIATNDAHPFQLNAVKTLGKLPTSRRQERMLLQVLASSNALARIEAYHTLVDIGSSVVESSEIRDTFVLDLVATKGPPMVYATRTGVPRIAIFGQAMPLKTPIVYTALENKLTIASPPDGHGVTVFDRTGSKIGGVQARIQPELYELIRRLGGGDRAEGEAFAMSYSDLIAVVKGLADKRYIAANFILQDSKALQDELEDAPPLPSEAALATPGKADGDPARPNSLGLIR